MLVLGIDPGLQVTGLAAIDNQSVVLHQSVRGVRGAGNDYVRVTSAANRIAASVAEVVADLDPQVIAIENFIDQGAARKQMSYRWQTPVVIGALAHALQEWADRIVWQSSAEVLSNGPKGYGLVAYLARQGRLGYGLDAPVNEHEASAIAHALWADAVGRQMALIVG
jgi:hypothetical protein